MAAVYCDLAAEVSAEEAARGDYSEIHEDYTPCKARAFFLVLFDSLHLLLLELDLILKLLFFFLEFSLLLFYFRIDFFIFVKRIWLIRLLVVSIFLIALYWTVHPTFVNLSFSTGYSFLILLLFLHRWIASRVLNFYRQIEFFEAGQIVLATTAVNSICRAGALR